MRKGPLKVFASHNISNDSKYDRNADASSALHDFPNSLLTLSICLSCTRNP